MKENMNMKFEYLPNSYWQDHVLILTEWWLLVPTSKQMHDLRVWRSSVYVGTTSINHALIENQQRWIW